MEWLQLKLEMVTAETQYAKTSVSGTFETCLPTLRMSAHRGRPELDGAGQNDAIDPDRTTTPNCAGSGSREAQITDHAPRLVIVPHADVERC